MSVNRYENGELKQLAGNAFGIVDAELDAESKNPVQNKVVTEAIDAILDGTTPAGDAAKVLPSLVVSALFNVVAALFNSGTLSMKSNAVLSGSSTSDFSRSSPM